MFNTIKTWVHRIRNYEQLKRDIELISEGIQILNDQNNRHVDMIDKLFKKVKRTQREARVLRRKLNENEGYRKNLYSMATILSEGTWKEGDNMMEAIDTAQERKYLKQHGEDFLMIMNGNVPEIAARELFEYFEVEVPETDIEDKTARSMHHLWCNWYLESFAFTPGKENKALHKTFEELSEREKNKFREDARYLWYTGHQK